LVRKGERNESGRGDRIARCKIEGRVGMQEIRSVGTDAEGKEIRHVKEVREKGEKGKKEPPRVGRPPRGGRNWD